MKKRVFLCSILLACLCLILMGCDINVNLNSEKKDKKSDKESIRSGALETEEYEYYYSNVDYSYIDLGNEYYIIVFGNDDDGYTTWTYETEKTYHYDETITEYLGCYDDKIVYILDNGIITLLNAKNGECIFRHDTQILTHPYYDIDYTSGKAYFFLNDNYTEFLALDKKGNILQDIDLAEYDSELNSIPSANWNIDFGEENEIKMIGATEAEDYKEKLVKINLKNFEVTVQNIEHEEPTENTFSEKAIVHEYSQETYYFNEDGTFEQLPNFDYLSKYGVLRYKGNWSIDGNLLVLDVTEVVIADGGHYEYSKEERSFVDYEEKSIPAEMSYVYLLRYYPDYDGKECISLDGMLYEILEPVG